VTGSVPVGMGACDRGVGLVNPAYAAAAAAGFSSRTRRRVSALAGHRWAGKLTWPA